MNMEPTLQPLPLEDGIDIPATCRAILECQRKNGEIPFRAGDKTDPWDHVEAAMGLCIGGHFDEARAAFEWLARAQLPDGSWYSAYKNGEVLDKTRESHMAAYLAVGLFHYYRITGDLRFVRKMERPLISAIAFAAGLQAPGGEVHWAVSPEGVVDPMALLTASSSVCFSFKCAGALLGELGRRPAGLDAAIVRLEDAIRFRPHLFNMTKSRYSMDWFYPVLCGALTGQAARGRIKSLWKKFVVEGMGVRCVSDRPWITLAETSELVIALAAMGDRDLARIVFSWIQDRRFDDGSYFCGFTVPDMTVWPTDKPPWTNAVVLMAADALYGITPAGDLFDHACWTGP